MPPDSTYVWDVSSEVILTCLLRAARPSSPLDLCAPEFVTEVHKERGCKAVTVCEHQTQVNKLLWSDPYNESDQTKNFKNKRSLGNE